jgi:DNA-binding NarL/FixJ family response regulator
MEVAQREHARHDVIVVEGDAFVREMIAAVLSDEGYLVTAFMRIAHDTFPAIQALQPHVLICDLRLPGEVSSAQLLELIMGDAVSSGPFSPRCAGQ